jgi:hypothetical protein
LAKTAKIVPYFAFYYYLVLPAILAYYNAKEMSLVYFVRGETEINGIPSELQGM